MPDSTPKTVLLHGRDSETDDGEASAAVTPGELVTVSGGEAPDGLTFGPHGTAGQKTAPRFAVEYSHTGGSIDHDYSSGDHMEYRNCLSGDEVYALLDAGETVTAGTYLLSAGNGALSASAGDGTDDAGILAEAVEDVDNSGGSDPVRVRIEVV